MNSGKTSRPYSSARRRGVATTEVVLKNPNSKCLKDGVL